MNQEIEHDYANEIVCPYCGHCFTDSYESEEGEVECETCEKGFVLTVHKLIYYSTKQREEAT